jgi:hypothetical protein
MLIVEHGFGMVVKSQLISSERGGQAHAREDHKHIRS